MVKTKTASNFTLTAKLISDHEVVVTICNLKTYEIHQLSYDFGNNYAVDHETNAKSGKSKMVEVIPAALKEQGGVE